MSLRETPEGTAPPRTAKVFGERNCGTNLFAELLRMNTGLKILPGGAPSSVRRAARRMPARERERMLDGWHSCASRWTLGWKHAYIDEQTHQRIDDRRILAVAMTKHPLAWLTSLRRNPYHLVQQAGGLGLQKLGRERLPYLPADFRDIWTIKHARYLELADEGSVHIVRFEDLVADPVESFGEWVERNQITCLGDLRTPTADVKGQSRTKDQISQYYASEHWRSELQPGDTEWFESIDSDLTERLSYQ